MEKTSANSSLVCFHSHLRKPRGRARAGAESRQLAREGGEAGNPARGRPVAQCDHRH